MSVTTARLVFLGGALHPMSRTNQLARWCGRQSPALGAASTVFTGTDLVFPFYQPGDSRDDRVRRYLSALADSDGVILLSPAYHGAPSGLLKNALDYVNDLSDDSRPYLDGRAIGCVALSGGPQGAMSTMACLRAIAHALRGWPTPQGVTLDTTAGGLLPDGGPSGERARAQLTMMLTQVLTLAAGNARARAAQTAGVG